ncbi:MAG: STAS domain-containing protein [Bacteroidetes bacterium]|nr:STAS domain-containing protein [Bacteroidota bacterium]
MNVKINTKEKFHVISVVETVFSANMTEYLRKSFDEVTQNPVKHIILNLSEVKEIDPDMAGFIAEQQQLANEEGRSFVVCGMQPGVKELFEKEDLLDLINHTPTESEAWDIVQMEEIERELLDGEDE